LQPGYGIGGIMDKPKLPEKSQVMARMLTNLEETQKECNIIACVNPGFQVNKAFQKNT